MATYRLLIEYNGSQYSGWQIQPGTKTIQEAIEHALHVALRSPVRLTASGRTDAGVHARGQVAHFSVGNRERLDTHRLLGSLNGLLADDIAILAIRKTSDDFHARYDAHERSYWYHVATQSRALDRHTRVLLRPAPDFNRMNRSAKRLYGRYDFSAFCKTGSDTKNRICEVRQAFWTPENRQGDYRFVISADRFLHGMVRAIVGTLLEIGRNKRGEDEIASILAEGDRRAAGPAAPAKGLVLQEVRYNERREPGWGRNDDT